MTTAISKKSTAPSGCAAVFLVLFLGVFVVIGFGVGWRLTVLPILRVLASRAWPGVPCEVVSSRVLMSDGTGRPDIQYRYRILGRAYTSGRYDFTEGTSSFISRHQAVVNAYPPGRRFECYVDPAHPAEAVINREWSLGYVFGAIFFAFFALIPGGLRYARIARGVQGQRQR